MLHQFSSNLLFSDIMTIFKFAHIQNLQAESI